MPGIEAFFIVIYFLYSAFQHLINARRKRST
jgi:hypothetical protein